MIILFSCTAAHRGAHKFPINVSLLSIFSFSSVIKWDYSLLITIIFLIPQAWIEHLQMKSNQLSLKESTLSMVKLIFEFAQVERVATFWHEVNPFDSEPKSYESLSSII